MRLPLKSGKNRSDRPQEQSEAAVYKAGADEKLTVIRTQKETMLESRKTFCTAREELSDYE
ncbi:MAG: hypothetical protein ACLTDV_12360 [Eubacterium sp.]